MIMSQRGGNPFQMAERFVKGEVIDEDMAIQGAKDIIAEYMNENEVMRARLRQLFQRKSVLTSKILKGKNEEAQKYKDFFDFNEPLYKIPSHRFLAIYRGEREGLLGLKVQPEKEVAIEQMELFFVKSDDECGEIVAAVCKDAYTRLLCPSLENETINEAKEKADIEAIKIFSTNLKQLLT
jgi:protein Tex